MLTGVGRHHLSGDHFSVRANRRAPAVPKKPGVQQGSGSAETASGSTNTLISSFLKPVGMPQNAGLVSDGPLQQTVLARQMFDNDPIAGAVAETLSNIPFGKFSLSGMPDSEHLTPYLRSLDHMRTSTLMPLLTCTYLVDGAFLGSGMFDANRKCWTAIVLQDLVHANIQSVPFFGATPIIDVSLTPEVIRSVSSGDPRMARYREFLGGQEQRDLQRLQPENTFYIPRRTISHHVLGQSLFRRIMILYTLETALSRGTIELAYRRQRPLLHLQVGDENWDASIDEMSAIAKLFTDADMDPVAATVVTRPGVLPQEVGGASDAWKWTDNIDVLTSAKLKGLGMPDGLLGGDVALDSVSATLTVFINMTRQLRDYITRAFLYEKVFPYVAITNGHRRDVIVPHAELARRDDAWRQAYRAYAADTDVDMSDYVQPTVSWHNSLRPEGDREYMGLLTELGQAGVPVPLRIMASAGGLDIHDIMAGEKDDIEVRGDVAKYQANINALQQALQPDDQGSGGDSGGGDDFSQYAEAAKTAEGLMTRLATPLRRKGMANREWSDRDLPRTKINGHSYVTTPRERKRRIEEENRTVAAAAAIVAARENYRTKRRPDVTTHAPRRETPV